MTAVTAMPHFVCEQCGAASASALATFYWKVHLLFKKSRELQWVIGPKVRKGWKHLQETNLRQHPSCPVCDLKLAQVQLQVINLMQAQQAILTQTIPSASRTNWWANGGSMFPVVGFANLQSALSGAGAALSASKKSFLGIACSLRKWRAR